MAGESMIEFGMEQRPLTDLDLQDTAAVRDWIKFHAERRISRFGTHHPTVRFLSAGLQETGDLQALVEAGQPEAALAAIFHQLAARPGVIRRIREGEVLVNDLGMPRRAVGVLEHLPGDDGDSWWLAYRFVATGDGGVGVLVGDWIEREGVGLEALGRPFRGWLDTGDQEALAYRQTPAARPPQPGDFTVSIATWDTSTLGNAVAVADLIGQHTDAEILARGLDHHVVFVVLDGAVERWDLHGRPPCSMDDLIRNITGVADYWAVGLLQPDTVILEGVERKAVSIFVEMAGRRAKRVLAVTFIPDGTLKGLGVALSDEGEVPAGEGWIGVEPSVDLDLGRVRSARSFGGGSMPEA